jgi:hypothetical protein
MIGAGQSFFNDYPAGAIGGVSDVLLARVGVAPEEELAAAPE